MIKHYTELDFPVDKVNFGTNLTIYVRKRNSFTEAEGGNREWLSEAKGPEGDGERKEDQSE